MRKAFDKVWQESLLYKRTQSLLPSSGVHFLRLHLSDSIFWVSDDGVCSRAVGVPQGSVLGPVLYLVYTNDLPVYPGVTLSLYTDDVMFHYSLLTPRFPSVMLQRQLNILPDWLRNCRVAINTGKSETICFTSKTLYTPVSLIEGKPIPFSNVLVQQPRDCIFSFSVPF